MSAIRFTGLASGLDTESMVNAMTMQYKNKVDQSNQNKLLMEMKKEVYKDVSKAIKDFHTNITGKLRLESSFNSVKVTNSNTSLVTINSGSKSGTNTISEITALAKSAKLDTESTGKTSDTKLSDVISFTQGEDIAISVNGKQVILKEDMTLGKLADEMNKVSPDLNISYDNTAKAFFATSKKTGLTQEINLEVVNGTVDSDGKFIETSKNTEVLKQLGLGAAGDSNVSVSGSNSSFKFNGINIVSESNTVNIDGLSVTINGTTVGPEEVTIGAVVDNESIFNQVKTFVDEYNTLIDKLNTLTSAKSNRNYKPLTDEQKKEMTEEDIKLWNKKINDSLLSNDPTLKNITSDLREILNESIPGVGNLRELGITTGSWQDKGRLTIDETKLRKLIDTDPDKVIGVLAGQDGNDGLIDKVYANLDKHFKSVSGVKTSLSVFSDAKLDKNIQEEIAKGKKLQERVDKMQDLYYKKFTAMEKMMQKLNSQSSWLGSQMG